MKIKQALDMLPPYLTIATLSSPSQPPDSFWPFPVVPYRLEALSVLTTPLVSTKFPFPLRNFPFDFHFLWMAKNFVYRAFHVYFRIYSHLFSKRITKLPRQLFFIYMVGALSACPLLFIKPISEYGPMILRFPLCLLIMVKLLSIHIHKY